MSGGRALGGGLVDFLAGLDPAFDSLAHHVHVGVAGLLCKGSGFGGGRALGAAAVEDELGALVARKLTGLEVGYCIMVGGDEADFHRIEPLLQTLSPPNGYMFCGPAGAGHFVKMVHNGIEYAMMAAYGEGFELISNSPYGKGLSLEKLANLWNQGSVVRSWLLELLESAFDAKIVRHFCLY